MIQSLFLNNIDDSTIDTSSDVATALSNFFNKLDEYPAARSDYKIKELKAAYNKAYSEADKFVRNFRKIVDKAGFGSKLNSMRGITSFVNEVTLANNTKINNTRTSYIKALDNINRNNYLGTLAKRAAIFGAAVSIGQMGYYGLVKKDFDKLGSSASQVIGGVYGAAGGATLGGAITAALGGTALGSILIPTAIVLGAVAVGYIGTKIGGFVWDGTKDLREALEEKIADSLEILADPNTDWGDWNTLSGFILDESKNLIEKLQEKITDSLEILTDSDTDWGDCNTFLGWLGLNRDGDAHQYDPLALDLNGNGIETLAAGGHKGAMFDHERNGIRTATGWVHSNDGLLVHDRDGDGKISDGSEIFGDNTPLKNGKTAAHGFAALAELDDNGDGKVDAADKTFSKLGVWRDLNHNGISEAGEIFALKDLHIQSLNLACKNADKDLGNGNTLAEVGSYTDADGNEHIMGDLQLAADRFHSRFSDSIELTDAQRREVNLGGSGRVRDLREAAAQSSELAEVLQQYKNAATKEEQLALRGKLLQAWANTDKSRDSIIKISADFTIRTQQDRRRGIGLTPSQIRHMQSIMSRNIWELIGESDPDGKRQAELYRRIGVLDSFTGTRSSRLYYFNEAQAKHIIDTANGTYDKLVDSLYDGLLFQTRLRPYLDAMRLRVDEKGEYSLDYSGVSALFNEIHKKNPGKAFTDLGELLAKSNDGKNPALAQLAEQHTQYMAEAAQNGTLTQYAETLGKKNMDTLGHRIGTDDNDNLVGNASANYLTGGAGDDKLYGGKGHDTLVGGAGNDYMEGGDYESDTYHFARGHGKDTVYDWSHNDEEADTLRFHGAQSGAAVIDREGYDLTIRAYGSGEQVNIKDYFWNNTRNHYNLQFDDTTLTNHDLAARSFTVKSTTDAGEKLYGWESHDTIHAGAGDDHITAYGGNDTIHAGAGNDTIDAGAGDDTIDAGTGNDKIDGGEGNDKIDGGDGDDTLYGGKGRNELTGGAGNDYMEGGDYEADTYHFARGHGKDTVYDWSRGAAEADTLTFHGAKAKDAVFGREGSDLTIRAYGNAGDQVTVQSYYSRPGQNYYNLQFDDITYKAADIRERTLETEGLPTATTATDKAGEVAPATTVPAENNQSGTDGQTVMEPVSGTAVNAGTTGVINAAETATTDRTPSGANSQTTTASANSAAADAGATGVNKTAAATADNAPSGADSQTTTAPAASEATVTETENANKAAESTATAATPDIDAQAAAQAHRLITAMAASDGRSASTEALAAPPLQQPPLAAAATDSTAKPLLP